MFTVDQGWAFQAKMLVDSHEETCRIFFKDLLFVRIVAYSSTGLYRPRLEKDILPETGDNKQFYQGLL